jgi:hypothetical protein
VGAAAATLALALLGAAGLLQILAILARGRSSDGWLLLPAGSLAVPLLFLPLLLRGVRAWLLACLTCLMAVVGCTFVLLAVWASLSSPRFVADVVAVFGAALTLPASYLVALRHGDTPWARVIHGTTMFSLGLISGVATLIVTLTLLPVPDDGFLKIATGLAMLMTFLWLPTGYGADWFISPPTPPPTPPLAVARAPTPRAAPRLRATPKPRIIFAPVAPLRRAAGGLVACTIMLSWVFFAARIKLLRGRLSDGGPVRPEMIVAPTGAFAIAATPVTRRQFDLVTARERAAGAQDLDGPVSSMTATEAKSYCDLLSALEHYPKCYEASESADCGGYRLPTPAEWRIVQQSEPLEEIIAKQPPGLVWLLAHERRPAPQMFTVRANLGDGADTMMSDEGGAAIGFRVARTITVEQAPTTR